MDITTLVTTIILLASIFMYTEGFSMEVSYVRSNIDGHRYLVRNLEDKVVAADTLAQLRKQLTSFVHDIKKAYPNNTAVSRLMSKFRPYNLTESSSDSKFTSYSVNKGEKIVFCLRQRDESGKLVQLNTLMFVALHELAHIMTVSIGHSKEFWTNFRFLLKFALKRNYYQYQPFHTKPEPYCGTMITDTPLK